MTRLAIAALSVAACAAGGRAPALAQVPTVEAGGFALDPAIGRVVAVR